MSGKGKGKTISHSAAQRGLTAKGNATHTHYVSAAARPWAPIHYGPGAPTVPVLSVPSPGGWTPDARFTRGATPSTSPRTSAHVSSSSILSPHVDSAASSSLVLASSSLTPTSTSAASSSMVPASSKTLGKRKAEVRNLTRGSKKLGLEVAGDGVQLDDAIKEYRRDVKSAGDTSHYNVATWRDFHDEVNWSRFGLPRDEPPVPLTPLKLEVIGAVFKRSGYRSCKNYVDAMKAEHILAGHPWSDQLDMCYSRFNASTSRGMGPARQSEPLPYRRMTQLDWKNVKNPRYPVAVQFVAVLCTFFLLRDLEATTAEYADMAIDVKDKKVSLRLSMSKNDPRALGCERTWGCICGEEVDACSCPYHAAFTLRDTLTDRFGDTVNSEGFPLFPADDGAAIRDNDMLTLIEDLAQRLGEPLFTKTGQRRYGKHSWRATGAVHLSEIGLDTAKVQLIGRWMCAVALRYVRNAPIADIARDYRTAIRARGVDDHLNKSTAINTKIRKDLDKWIDTYRLDMSRLTDLIQTIEKTCGPKRFVVNRKTKKIHKVLTHSSDVGTQAIAYCGWKYALAPITCSYELPAGAKKDYCATCLADVRATMG